MNYVYTNTRCVSSLTKTSPILYFLYQRNADPKTLEESKVAQDLHSVLDGQTTVDGKNEDVAVISLGHNGTMPERHLSSASVPKTPRLSSPRIAPREDVDQFDTTNNLPPRRYSRMTLF